MGIPSLYFTLVKKYSHILSDQAALDMEAAYNYPHVGHVLFLVEVCAFFFSFVEFYMNISRSTFLIFFLHLCASM